MRKNLLSFVTCITFDLFAGRRDYRGGDLRDKLVRRYSPRRRYSPDREGRGRNVFPGHKGGHHERGNHGGFYFSLKKSWIFGISHS